MIATVLLAKDLFVNASQVLLEDDANVVETNVIQILVKIVENVF